MNRGDAETRRFGEVTAVILRAGLEIHRALGTGLLTYLKLSGATVGLLINFNVPILKQGIKRLVHGCAEASLASEPPL